MDTCLANYHLTPRYMKSCSMKMCLWDIESASYGFLHFCYTEVDFDQALSVLNST